MEVTKATEDRLKEFIKGVDLPDSVYPLALSHLKTTMKRTMVPKPSDEDRELWAYAATKRWIIHNKDHIVRLAHEKEKYI